MKKPKAITDLFKPYMFTKNAYKGGRPAPVGMKTYKLSSNENALGTSPRVKEAISNVSDYHIYPDNTDEKLRNGLSNHHNAALSADHFICGNSGSEILEMALKAFITPGDEVILSNPCFLPYHTFSQRAGATVIDVPLKGDEYTLDVQGIISAITDLTRIIFLTSPNNPTGTIIPARLLDELLSQVPDHILVIYDEVYYQYAQEEYYTTAIEYVNKGHNILAINSFSKAYGMAALRLGYGYTTSTIAGYLKLFQRPFLINKLSMVAGLAALSDHEFIKRTVLHNTEQRVFLSKAFDRLGLRYTPTNGNFFLTHPELPSEDLVNSLYDRGVLVRDVSNFGAPGKVRITIGTEEGNKALVRALEEIL